MPLGIVDVPNPREPMDVVGVVVIGDFLSDHIIFAGMGVFVIAVANLFGPGRAGGKIGATENRPLAILGTIEVAYEVDGVVYVLHIDRGAGIGADKDHAVRGIADEDKAEAVKGKLDGMPALPHRPADTQNDARGDQGDKEIAAGIERQGKVI